jgi:hypothetical protein
MEESECAATAPPIPEASSLEGFLDDSEPWQAQNEGLQAVRDFIRECQKKARKKLKESDPDAYKELKRRKALCRGDILRSPQ